MKRARHWSLQPGPVAAQLATLVVLVGLLLLLLRDTLLAAAGGAVAGALIGACRLRGLPRLRAALLAAGTSTELRAVWLSCPEGRTAERLHWAAAGALVVMGLSLGPPPGAVVGYLALLAAREVVTFPSLFFLDRPLTPPPATVEASFAAGLDDDADQDVSPVRRN